MDETDMTELRGRHGITLGSSITGPATTSMHALKYNFQPSTIDPSRPSTLSGDSGGDYTLLVPSKEGQAHVFRGPETAGKEIDCVLIYDASTGSYVLERIGSVLRLDHQRHAQVAATETEEPGEKEIKRGPDPDRHPEAEPKVVVEEREDAVPGVVDEEHEEEEDDDDDDDEELDDFANLLESTLDASTQKSSSASNVQNEGGKIHTPIARRPSENTRNVARDDESSEDED
ncbi:Predicted protein [Taphrina deformans PYCC 5710]|uniref:Transcription elongation factor Eaf N-terminal domain-containing protein n=1 Tax=Taphrina deformans (strain PYCC 5710 / ATCC 11124 / CBS 356.35 / IMI 108563 / JCM 9778 / NBRC 8474) TaxID=1097556 RepID=R4XBH7_TAPDE|nr:Predicted protein [Taphrina deformans PYCC 5710]|eukprot:CCG81726.1 Predicted protein [Taphrina deformans PYCC 5710]